MANDTRFTLRCPPALAKQLQEAADAGNRSLHAEALQRLAASFQGDKIILGWVKLDRWGELDHHKEEPAECPECGQDMNPGDAYVGLVQMGGFYGPVCGGCATSE